jgi:hypothetical protein
MRRVCCIERPEAILTADLTGGTPSGCSEDLPRSAPRAGDRFGWPSRRGESVEVAAQFLRPGRVASLDMVAEVAGSEEAEYRQLADMLEAEAKKDDRDEGWVKSLLERAETCWAKRGRSRASHN